MEHPIELEIGELYHPVHKGHVSYCMKADKTIHVGQEDHCLLIDWKIPNISSPHLPRVDVSLLVGERLCVVRYHGIKDFLHMWKKSEY